jgi:glycosyltransferase involved in cell wall biosynthesis
MAVRGLGRVFDRAPSWKHRMVNAVVRRLYARAAAASRVVWFTNPVDRQRFIERGMITKERTLLTRNAVNLAQYSMDVVDPRAVGQLRAELGIASDALVVVMVARLIWSKGIAEFADAAAQIRATHPHVHFVLVAPREDGSAGAVPVDWIKAREAAGDIHWLEFRKDVLTVYALGDIAVLPSYYNEGGYPRALLEPMALGKPVIAADTPVCRGPVAEGVNGLLVPPKDARALAAAIERLVTDVPLRARFGAASLERIRREFDDRIVAQEVLGYIASALAQTRGKGT